MIRIRVIIKLRAMTEERRAVLDEEELSANGGKFAAVEELEVTDDA